ncbi:MAG: hypothetical protein ACTSX0_00615, partial [Promethearchaeota archaeon]
TIEQHDRYNFEVKLDYTLVEDFPINKYELEVYFFIPSALQVNQATYHSEDFYTDLTNYIRFKTPQMALSGLLNRNNPKSPFAIIYQKLEKIKNGDTSLEHFNRINYELRVLGCILKSTLRDQADLFLKNREIVNANSNPHIFNEFNPVDEGELEFFDELLEIQNRFKKLEVDLQIAQIPLEIQETFTFVDKYINRQIIDHCGKIYLRLFNQENSDTLYTSDISLTSNNTIQTLKKKLIKILDYESAKFNPLNLKFQTKSHSSNENIPYWDGILKKYVQSVLYLSTKPSKEKSKTLQLLYSLAAGFAMFISILLGFWVVDNFASNTYAYITLLIVVYMLKDRFKEWIRQGSHKFMNKFFPDRKFLIFDTIHERKIGISKESVRFLHFSQIPQDIINIRERGSKISIERGGKPEVVYKYVKLVELKTDKITEFHERNRDVNDIIRFNIKRFLQYADDPETTEINWDPKSKQIKKVKCIKVYHLNVIFRLREISSKNPLSPLYYKKIRVILDQFGIRRVTERKVV